jgi:hypothetical protein
VPDRVILALLGESTVVSPSVAVVAVDFLFVPRVLVSGTGGVATFVVSPRGLAAAPDVSVVVAAAAVGQAFFFLPRAFEGDSSVGVVGCVSVAVAVAAEGVAFFFLPRALEGGSTVVVAGSVSVVVAVAAIGLAFFFLPPALEGGNTVVVAGSVMMLLRGSTAAPDVPVVTGTGVTDDFIFVPWLFGGGNGRVGWPSSVMLLRRASAANSSRVFVGATRGAGF